MADVRKNQSQLTRNEWDRFIGAIDAIRRRGASSPTYKDFVDVHVEAMEGRGMHTWGVHSMAGMEGRNFLAWHRWYLRRLERRLQKESPRVTIPYWDWVADPRVPAAINRPAQLERWRISRQQPDPDSMPEQSDVRAAMRRERFRGFQLRLESLHGWVHVAVGGESGEMSTARSPQDPLFWLHHANVDRLWARWQERHPRQRPRNSDEGLKPRGMFGIKVAETLRISNLGYRYR